MRQLKIMSMDFTPNFLLSRRMIPGQNEKMMKIATSYIQEDQCFDVILLQGHDVYKRAIELAKQGNYCVFSEKNTSSAILTKQELPVYEHFNIPKVGNIIILPTVYNFLSIASVSLINKKEEEITWTYVSPLADKNEDSSTKSNEASSVKPKTGIATVIPCIVVNREMTLSGEEDLGRDTRWYFPTSAAIWKTSASLEGMSCCPATKRGEFSAKYQPVEG